MNTYVYIHDVHGCTVVCYCESFGNLTFCTCAQAEVTLLKQFSGDKTEHSCLKDIAFTSGTLYNMYIDLVPSCTHVHVCTFIRYSNLCSTHYLQQHPHTCSTPNKDTLCLYMHIHGVFVSSRDGVLQRVPSSPVEAGSGGHCLHHRQPCGRCPALPHCQH